MGDGGLVGVGAGGGLAVAADATSAAGSAGSAASPHAAMTTANATTAMIPIRTMSLPAGFPCNPTPSTPQGFAAATNRSGMQAAPLRYSASMAARMSVDLIRS